MTRRTDVLIIGAGQAGLAMSHRLTVRGIEHAVLERGQVGQRWAERRASLRLLTPNWMTRLPGHRYDGTNPDGFLCRDQVIGLLQSYARASDAPVLAGVTVERVEAVPGGYRVATGRGVWLARAVVLATGFCDRPLVPALARGLDRRVRQVTADRYSGAGGLADGGILVVGAAASGLQIADEIARSGRPVTLCAGRHVRVPRRYRGRDIFHWLDACGVLTETRRPGSTTADRMPSFQLVGGNDDIDLGTVAAAGVRVVGRLVAAEGTRLALGGSLAAEMAAAEALLARLLDRIDAHVARQGLDAPAGTRPAPVRVPAERHVIDLAAEGIGTIVWATGYARDYSWLGVPVVRPDGELDQTGGVTPAPGLFALGLPFMRRRNSTFIDGVGADAEEIAAAVASHLGASVARAA